MKIISLLQTGFMFYILFCSCNNECVFDLSNSPYPLIKTLESIDTLNERRFQRYTYDSKFRLIQTDYSGSTIKYEYADKQIVSKSNASGIEKIVGTYFLNSANLVDSIVKYDGLDKTKLVYNSDGFYIFESFYTKDNILTSTLYRTVQDGNIISDLSSILFDSSSYIWTFSDFDFNNENTLSHKNRGLQFYGEDSKHFAKKFVFEGYGRKYTLTRIPEYDSKGRIVKILTYYPSNAKAVTNVTYY